MRTSDQVAVSNGSKKTLLIQLALMVVALQQRNLANQDLSKQHGLEKHYD